MSSLWEFWFGSVRTRWSLFARRTDDADGGGSSGTFEETLRGRAFFGLDTAGDCGVDPRADRR
jgi:hypothetical protein